MSSAQHAHSVPHHEHRHGLAGQAVIDEHVIELIARRVAALLRSDQAHVASGRQQKRLVGADELAEMFSVSRNWVYDNASYLGAVKLGTGTRPRLRFDPEHVRKVLTPTGGVSRADSARRRQSHWIDEADLIPISR